MRISKLPTLFLALLACSTAAAQAFDYDDIADGRFRPAQLAGIRPTADGEHYTTIRDGNIFRHRYAVDDAGTALLPAAAEEGAVALDSLDRATGTWCDAGSRRLDIADYAIAPDGGVLVADGAEPIYRHSFTTHYLYYDGRRLREILLGIPSPRDAVFTPDGRNIVFSSRNNLYVYNIERQGTRQITRDGRWNETINGTTDWVYEEEFGFTRAFAVSPDKGFHTIAPSAGMRYYISTFSSADDPGRVEICDARGRTVRTVADNAALRRLADSIRLPRKEFFTFTTERGDTLGGYIVRPAGFDPARRYPCLLTQYSGPGSQTVQNRWKLDWEDVLAQRGYVVVATDGRGTGYRGEAFKKSTYGQLGRLEVEDQLSTARYMAAQPWIDAERIGIYGWSYGGFMALSCACKGDGLFKAAVAVAPVTSWRYYDTIYSELYNGLPQENPAGYNENAPLMLAPLLRDDRTRLLLIHGTADDNVHFQNSAEMIRALTDAGKEFDLMIYPDQNHSMQPDYTRQIRRRMISFVERNL